MQVTQSLFSASSIQSLVEQEYSLGRVRACHLHMSGVNDVYQVSAAQGTFFFKVYRQGWRTTDAVGYETDLLHHLSQAGVSVALPLTNQHNRAVVELGAPEGDRPAVLYRAALGHSPTWPFYRDAPEARLLGATLARLHTASNNFTSSYARQGIDAQALLDAPLAAMVPFVASVPDGAARFSNTVAALRTKLGALTEQGLSKTICHGDFHCGNVFLTAERQVTVFDFDACGPGWVAFDLARWFALTREASGADSWEAFLTGYAEGAPLTEADREAVPLFATLRLLHWAQIKLTFVQRGQWDTWDVSFFLSDLLSRIEE